MLEEVLVADLILQPGEPASQGHLQARKQTIT
jgi:hypothetical protein